MKALLRPAFVLGVSIAIAATSLVGSSSVALAANLSRPLITARWLDLPVYEGGSVFLNGTFTDGTDQGPYSVDVDWGDGTFEQYTLADLDARTFRVQKTDAYQNDGVTLTIFVTVNDPIFSNLKSLPVTVENAAPSFDSFGLSATEIEAGRAVTATGAFTDGGVNTHTVKLDWDDGSPLTTLVLAAGARDFTTDAHTYGETGNYTVSVIVTDDALLWDGETATLTVRAANQAPVVGSLELSPSSVVDHELLTVSASFTDPDAADTFTFTVDWGDGTSSPEESLGTTRSFSATHAYDVARTVSITATLKDNHGASDTSTADLVVLPSNHAPTGLSFDASATGANVVVTGSFTDPDATDTHTVALDWGDGFTQDVAADGTTFTESHVYDASGLYTVTATVTDHPVGVSTEAVSKQVDVTVPATSASAVIEEMSSLVRSLNLDRNTERWLLKKLHDLQSSLAYGNGQVCGAGLDHILAFAQRTLENEQYAALSAFAPQLEAAAGCTSSGAQQSPKVQRAAAVTTTATPALTAPATTQKKDTTKDAAKAAKTDAKPTAGRGRSH
jgi:PKD repeat protein